MIELGTAWEALLDDRLPLGVNRRRLPSAEESDIFIAVRAPDMNPMLLIGLQDESSARFRPFEAEALKARIERFRDDQAFVAVELTQIQYFDLFVALSNDLLMNLEGASGPQVAHVVASRLNRWHDLLRLRRCGLSIDEQRGVIAELRVLQLLSQTFPEAMLHTLRGWVGPSGATHDFLYADFAVEVKAGARNAPLKISSVEQLWAPEGVGRFHLAVTPVSSHADGAPLAEYIRSVRETFGEGTDEARAQLESQLAMMGWDDDQASEYTNLWCTDEVQLFEIRDGFPRVDPRELPPGISVPRYLLDLAAIEEFRVPLEDLTVSVPTVHVE